MQAHSGLAAAAYPGDEPSSLSLITLTDILGGLVCAMGVLASLLKRVRTGEGSRVESSLYSAAGVIPGRTADLAPASWKVRCGPKTATWSF